MIMQKKNNFILFFLKKGVCNALFLLFFSSFCHFPRRINKFYSGLNCLNRNISFCKILRWANVVLSDRSLSHTHPHIEYVKLAHSKWKCDARERNVKILLRQTSVWTNHFCTLTNRMIIVIILLLLFSYQAHLEIVPL